MTEQEQIEYVMRSVTRHFFSCTPVNNEISEWYTKGQTPEAVKALYNERGNTDLPGRYLWYPGDDINLWKRNVKSMPENEREFWEKNPIKYDLNYYGHRMSENPTPHEDNIIFLGCSLTFGIGVHKEDTWAYQIAKTLNKREINFGSPGGSLDTCFRLYYTWQRELKAPLTILMVPPGIRREVMMETRPGQLSCMNRGIWTMRDAKKLWDNIDDALLNAPSDYISRAKNLLAIQKLAENTDSKLIIVDTRDMLNQKTHLIQKYWDKSLYKITNGRDQMHPGRNWNFAVANYILHHHFNFPLQENAS